MSDAVERVRRDVANRVQPSRSDLRELLALHDEAVRVMQSVIRGYDAGRELHEDDRKAMREFIAKAGAK